MKIPFERRPVTGDPAEARRLAYQSLAAMGQAPGRRRSVSAGKRKAKSAPLTAGGLRYLEAELRWQAHLRRKAGRRTGQDVLDLVKAKRARLDRRAPLGLDASPGAGGGPVAPGAAGGGSGSTYIDGSDPEPLAGHSQAEVDALGAKGEALRINGRWAWPVTGRRDLINLVAAWKDLRPGDKASEVKRWLKARAIALKLEEHLPASWLLTVPTPVRDRE